MLHDNAQDMFDVQVIEVLAFRFGVEGDLRLTILKCVDDQRDVAEVGGSELTRHCYFADRLV